MERLMDTANKSMVKSLEDLTLYTLNFCEDTEICIFSDAGI